METNGNVSVILNTENRPVTPSDMGIKAAQTEISYILIDNGTLLKIFRAFENQPEMGYG